MHGHVGHRTIADVDPGGNAYTIASDGLGSYFNGVGNVSSILTCNGYNGIKNGDWQFNKPVSNKMGQRLNARNLGVSLNFSDAVQPGDPHYTAPANPPFWGTEIRYAYSEVKCTLLNQSMLTMTAGTAMTCPMIFSFFTASNAQYGLNPAHSFNNFPENTDVQISCNAVNSGGCTGLVHRAHRLTPGRGASRAERRLVQSRGFLHEVQDTRDAAVNVAWRCRARPPRRIRESNENRPGNRPICFRL